MVYFCLYSLQNGNKVYSNTVNTGMIRYDMRCYFNVSLKADISQLNLPHWTKKLRKKEKLKSKKKRICSEISVSRRESVVFSVNWFVFCVYFSVCHFMLTVDTRGSAVAKSPAWSCHLKLRPVPLKFSASEVTTLWRYTNLFIIIIIIISQMSKSS